MLYYVYASTMHKMKKFVNIFFTLQNVFIFLKINNIIKSLESDIKYTISIVKFY